MRNSRLDELVISTDKTFLRAIAVVANLQCCGWDAARLRPSGVQVCRFATSSARILLVIAHRAVIMSSASQRLWVTESAVTLGKQGRCTFIFGHRATVEGVPLSCVSVRVCTALRCCITGADHRADGDGS